MKKLLLFLIFVLHVFIASSFLKSSQVQARGNRYYVSTTGSDTNSGSESQPFKTFVRAEQSLSPGDTLVVLAGEYTEPLVINKSGTSTAPILVLGQGTFQTILNGQNQDRPIVDVRGSVVIVSNMEVKNSNGICVDVGGSTVVISGLKVHECRRHGIYTDVDRTVIDSNIVYNTVLENSARSTSSGWSSAIKVRVGGQQTYISRNEVYNNYGEGIAVTRGVGATVENNTVYDNYSVNVYIDNSKDVVVERNNVYCNQNSGYERGGYPPSGIALGEESYSGWGAQLARVSIKNNVVAFCKNGVTAFSPNVPNGGLDSVTVSFNTFWGSVASAISLNSDTYKTRNTKFTNNIIQQPQNQFGSAASAGVSADYNFWVGSSPSSASNLGGAHDKSGDIRMATQPQRGNLATFKLSSSSPAIGAGLADGLTGYDIFGVFRSAQSGQSVDIGAFEYSAI